ncbi:hypothetical protein ROBYS_00390 [Roseobacter sp. OBYS 0001]|nr:hypothetical protein ROBYS_00390 [Roseobacter sp. OBYS 0001]
MKSLGGKIVVADELGLLENDLHEDLKQIKELRNSAAHNLHFTKFSHLSKQEALAAYEHLYTKYASDDFHEVDDLLFVSRFVYGTACQMVLQKLAVLFDRLLRP